MPVKVTTGSFEAKTRDEGEVVDVTREIREAVDASGMSEGLATVFVVGSTAAVTTMEFEPGLVSDFPEMLDRVAPRSGVEYEHQRRWHDGKTGTRT
jgi:thiamine phosphate synthase YjbQ (UPF0047 family)